MCDLSLNSQQILNFTSVLSRQMLWP